MKSNDCQKSTGVYYLLHILKLYRKKHNFFTIAENPTKCKTAMNSIEKKFPIQFLHRWSGMEMKIGIIDEVQGKKENVRSLTKTVCAR